MNANLVEFTNGVKLAIVTVAHVYETGTDDGGGEMAYTRLWLARMEG